MRLRPVIEPVSGGFVEDIARLFWHAHLRLTTNMTIAVTTLRFSGSEIALMYELAVLS